MEFPHSTLGLSAVANCLTQRGEVGLEQKSQLLRSVVAAYTKGTPAAPEEQREFKSKAADLTKTEINDFYEEGGRQLDQ